MSRDELNSIAWRDFMNWALFDKNMRREFTEATGVTFNDSAAYVVKFVEWATVNHFGIEHAPKAYREQLEARRD